MADDRSSAPPPFLKLTPPVAPVPLVIAVGHAGRFYPSALDQERAVAWETLHELEDRFADRLIGGAVAAGATAIIATHARGWIDLNRAEQDTDASPHARAGLGIVPQRLAGRPLWRRPTPAAWIAERIETSHRPYHDAIAAALRDAVDRHGHALLVDCHSMPPILVGSSRGAQIVIGDRHGVTAAPRIPASILEAARREGHHAARNAPYAGAHTIERHADPANGIHAVQIETDRRLYLDASLREPSDGLGTARRLFARLCAAGVMALEAEPQRFAAE
jgi:N-formylglutamate amidohydrolase